MSVFGNCIADMSRRGFGRFYLQEMVFPIIDGIAKRENLTLGEEVAKMIDEGVTIGAYARLPEYRRRLEEKLCNPATCFTLDRFRSHLDKPEHEIRASVPWWIDRIAETRPEVCKIITGRPEGAKWLGDTFIDITMICREFAGARP